jgi:hypothetical protein
MKTCKKCGETKPLDDFYRATGMHDGRRNDCKTCNLVAKKSRYDSAKAVAAAKRWQARNPERVRAYQADYRSRPGQKRAQRDRYYRRTYGLTADEVDEMLAAQSGVCAICRELPEVEARMHIDHDHRSGAIRGALCSRCNHAIGLLREDPVLFARAADYLGGR